MREPLIPDFQFGFRNKHTITVQRTVTQNCKKNKQRHGGRQILLTDTGFPRCLAGFRQRRLKITL